MKIKDAERIKLFVDNGGESTRAIEALTNKRIPFGERRWNREFPVNTTIRGKGQFGEKKLGASTVLSPPVLEVYFGPGNILWLEGLERILASLDSH